MTFGKKIIIDSACGSITNKYSYDTCVLVGECPYGKNNYANNLQLIIDKEDDRPITIDISHSGFNMQVFVGDFTGDKTDNVMVRGEYINPNEIDNEKNNINNYELGVIYKFENGNLIEIFNTNSMKNKNLCSAKFKNNYKASITCENKKYLIDLATKSTEYLNRIYDEDKKVKTNLRPTLDSPMKIYPIKQAYKDYYDLLIYQTIVGVNKRDVIGTIETLVSLEGEKLYVLYEGLLSYPYEEVNTLISEKRKEYKDRKRVIEGSKFIKFNSPQNISNNRVKKDDVNLIIKSIEEEENILYVDAYLLNLKKYELKSLSNLKVVLKDNQNKVLANKVFNKIDIGKGLKSQEKMRILLPFFLNEYNVLYGSDISDLICEINYDARS